MCNYFILVTSKAMGNIFHKNFPKVSQTVINEITATSTLTVNNNCISTSDFSQAILFSCVPLQNGKFYEENNGCTQCYRNISDVWTSQMEVQQALWKSNPPSIRTPFDKEFEQIMADQEACVAVCKACQYSNNSQTSTVTLKVECAFNEGDVANIQSQITSSLMQQLVSNGDSLSALAKTIGAGSQDDVETYLSDKITDTMTSKVLQAMILQVSGDQRMVFKTYAGASTNVTGNSQESMVNGMVQYLSSTNVASQVLTQDQWSTFEKLYQDNTTINELGDAVFGSVDVVANTIDTSLGQILIGIIILLGIIVLGVIIMVVVRKVQSKSKK
jgi:hypothetical protein